MAIVDERDLWRAVMKVDIGKLTTLLRKGVSPDIQFGVTGERERG